MSKKPFVAALIVLAVFLSAGLAIADETILDEVVVTANKSETPSRNVTRAVTVVDERELGKQSGVFIVDALRSIPGTVVRSLGTSGRITNAVLRGSGTAQVHVTIDGVHVASPTTGAFNFNNLTYENIERVEVMRGSASSLYGSDAMGGVINIMTRRGEGPMKYSYTQEVGGSHSFREIASAEGGVGPWHLSATAARYDTAGVSQNDDYGNSTYSARVGYDLWEDATFDWTVRHSLAVYGLDDGAFIPDVNRKDRERQTFTSGVFESPVTDWWKQYFRVSTAVENFIDNDPSDGSGNANSLFKLDTERYGAEWKNKFTPVSWDQFTLGLEYEDREADNRSFSKTQTNTAVYWQNLWNFWKPLTVVVGGRFFRENSFGTHKVLDASVSYLVEPWDMKFRGGWTEGFRVPTLNDLFFPGFSNPNLQPEESDNYEVGVDQSLWNGLLDWSATVFRTNYKNLIQFVGSAPINVSKARVDGVEFETRLHPADQWTIIGSYTHLEPHARPSEEELVRIPFNTASLKLQYAVDKKWDFGLEGQLISSREESQLANRRQKTKGYLVFHLYGQYHWTDWAKTFARVQNVTDQHYSEVLGFPEQGTLATVGVTFEK
jgi:vitamin B12 transporter